MFLKRDQLKAKKKRKIIKCQREIPGINLQGYILSRKRIFLWFKIKKKEKKKGEKKKKTESNKLYRFGIGYLHDTMHGHVQIIQQLIHFIS